jgi:hypothetical protein
MGYESTRGQPLRQMVLLASHSKSRIIAEPLAPGTAAPMTSTVREPGPGSSHSRYRGLRFCPYLQAGGANVATCLCICATKWRCGTASQLP